MANPHILVRPVVGLSLRALRHPDAGHRAPDRVAAARDRRPLVRLPDRTRLAGVEERAPHVRVAGTSASEARRAPLHRQRLCDSSRESMGAFHIDGKIVWRPTPELAAHSRLADFMARHGIPSLDVLQRRSTNDIEWFWDAVLRDLDIQFATPCSRIVDVSRGMAWPEWCPDGEMNIVHNLLDRHAGRPTDAKIALRWEGEASVGPLRSMTYAELRLDVCRAAAFLRSHGLGRGDVVG